MADGLLYSLNSVRCFAQGFADDFSALVIDKDLRTVREVKQAALHTVQRWCEDHGLSVNPDKTEIVFFTRKRTLPGLIPIVVFSKELK